MVRRPVDGRVDVRSHDTAPLCTGVCQADADTCCDSAFEGTDPLRPDDRVCGAGAGDSDDKGDVLDHWAVDRDEDDVAHDCGAFDWRLSVGEVRGSQQ